MQLLEKHRLHRVGHGQRQGGEQQAVNHLATKQHRARRRVASQLAGHQPGQHQHQQQQTEFIEQARKQAFLRPLGEKLVEIVHV